MSNASSVTLHTMGRNLKALRKHSYPRDDQALFARRINVSRSTYQKMEKGDSSIALGSYLRAAELFGVADHFMTLFQQPEEPLDLIKELDL